MLEHLGNSYKMPLKYSHLVSNLLTSRVSGNELLVKTYIKSQKGKQLLINI